MKNLFLLLACWLGVVRPTVAQKTAPAAPAFTLTCAGRTSPNALQKLYCDARDLTLPAPPAGTPLTVDARLNGSIAVRSWTGGGIRVRALVEGRAASPEAAKALAAAVAISSQNHVVRAARANESMDGWAVSYEVLVPATTDLVLRATNGSLAVTEVLGTIRAETTTGSVALVGVGGDVRVKTTNGSVNLSLTGPAWQGPGLDVATINGSINWQLPATYAATLTAKTVQGRVQAELNTARKSLLPHSLVATLGKGGAQLRATTVNGSVVVQQAKPPTTPEPAPEPEPEE